MGCGLNNLRSFFYATGALIRTRSAYWFGALLLILVYSTAPACAQQASPPVFRSQTSEVLVPTLVTDLQGNVIYGLRANDFVIRDNGVEQTARMDETFSYEPVSLVVAVQTGGHAGSVIGSGCAIQRDTNIFTSHVGQCKSALHDIGLMLETFLNIPGSKMALVSFDSQVKLRQDFSSDISDVTKSLDVLPGGDEGAAVLDAVQFSLNLLKRQPADRRKVLVVISKQKDDDSKTVTVEEAARQIIASNIEVYMIAYPPDFESDVRTVAKLFGPSRNITPPGSGFPGSPANSGVSTVGSLDILGLISLLRSAGSSAESNVPQLIANLTGGEYVLFKNRNGLDNALGLLANHAHNRYQLSFVVKNPAPGPHKLEVFLRSGGDVNISARAGYLLSTAPTQLPATGSADPK